MTIDEELRIAVEHHQANRLAEAEKIYRRILSQDPDRFNVLHLLGVVVGQLGQNEAAIEMIGRAIAVKPTVAEAHNDLGITFKEMGRFDEAIAAYRRALQLKPDFAEAHSNLGNALIEKGRVDEAIAAQQRAIDLKPDFVGAHWNLALLQLLVGDFRRGWPGYESRWKAKSLTNKPRHFVQPRWDGGDLHGKTIFLVAEQGFGDAIQFVRYAPLVAGRGGRVVLECRRPLQRLFASVKSISLVVCDDEPPPEFDVQCPLQSLPLVMGTDRLEAIPAMAPYVSPPAGAQARWKDKLPADASNLKVGLNWAGGPKPRGRSIPLAALEPLASIPGIDFYSLQTGPDVQQAHDPPAGMKLIDCSADLHDFADTAGLIANLDLVITVDTAVAHLAGAMAKPVWTLLKFSPDWRWMLDREDSPWYPTMRLFRQSALGDWEGVIRTVAAELSAFSTDADAMRQARQYRQAGNFAEAEKIYRSVVARRPNHAEALHSLGLLANQSGDQRSAAQWIERSIQAARPAPAFYFSNFALVLEAMGDANRAIECYRQAAALNPDDPKAHAILAVALTRQGRLDGAAKSWRAVIALKPDSAEAYQKLGAVLAQANRHAEAAAAYLKLVELRPQDAQAHGNLGLEQEALGQRAAAVESYRRAIAAKPELAGAHNNLGNVLREEGRLDEAAECYLRAAAIKPDYPDAWCNLSRVLIDQGRADEAVEACRKALEIKPDFASAYCNLSAVIYGQGRRAEAIEHCRRAIALSADSDEAHCEGHFNLGLALLATGDFARGWEEYEWRFRRKNYPPASRRFSQPRWKGEPLEGKRILLHPEQGFGDAIQFARYAPLVAKRGGRVILECYAPLQTLLSGVAGVEQVAVAGQPPPFDMQCPLMSLPLILGTSSLAAIPAQVPYVNIPAEGVEQWRRRLEPDKARLKVGLAWAGSAKNKQDRVRSIKLETLAPLGDVPGVVFYSLQFGERADQAAHPPPGMRLIDHTPELKNFQETALLVANLDLVITVDTATAHLAGALARPVWTLLPFAPDWRWMMDREDSPWYPTMRLFRQKRAGDWGEVIERVAVELQKLP